MNAAGMLSTANDGIGSTFGDQNTAADFTGFLGNPDITTNTASFTLSNLQAVGPPQVPVAGLVIQSFTGGTFQLFDPTNVLLLSGSLTTSALSGNLGPLGGGTGALFTTSFNTVTGGILAPIIDPASLTLSMNLSNVNSGGGFSIAGGPLIHLLRTLPSASAVIRWCQNRLRWAC